MESLPVRPETHEFTTGNLPGTLAEDGLQLLGVRDIMALFGVQKSRAYELLRSMPGSFRVGRNGRSPIRIRRRDVEAYVDSLARAG